MLLCSLVVSPHSINVTGIVDILYKKTVRHKK